MVVRVESKGGRWFLLEVGDELRLVDGSRYRITRVLGLGTCEVERI